MLFTSLFPWAQYPFSNLKPLLFMVFPFITYIQEDVLLAYSSNVRSKQEKEIQAKTSKSTRRVTMTAGD